MIDRITRRGFLRRASAGAAVAAVTCPAVLRAHSPNETVRVAAVGVGGKGWSDLNGAAGSARIVAFCDVETGKNRKGGFAGAAEKWPDARRYVDWREMLDKDESQAAVGWHVVKEPLQGLQAPG